MSDSRVPDNAAKFAYYKERLLSGDSEDVFVEFSQKFATWMDNRKAHYDDARPQIMDVCLAAYRNVLTRLGFEPDSVQGPIDLTTFQKSRWTIAYVGLIKALSNHVKHYEHDPPSVQGHLRFLLRTIGIPPQPPAVPGQTSSQAGPPRPNKSTSSSQPPVQTQSTPPLPQQNPQASASQSSQAGPSQPARPTPPLPHKARHALPKKKRQDLADLIDMDVGKSTATAAPSVKPEDTVNDLQHPSVTPERFRNEFADLQHPSVTPERFRNASAELQLPSVTTERRGDTPVQTQHPSNPPEPMIESGQIPNAPKNISVEPGPVLNNTTDASTLSGVSITSGAQSAEDVEFQRLTDQFLVNDDDMEVDSGPAGDLPSYQDIHKDKEPPPPPIVFLDAVLPLDPNVYGTYLDPGLSVHIDVALNEEQFRNILGWNERFGQTKYVNVRSVKRYVAQCTLHHARCISLSCFQSSDLQKPLGTLKPTWPSNPNIYLRTQHLPQPIALSVPVTGSIDLSPFLQQGDNRLVIEQSQPMQGFGWIVFEHRPTKQQLEILESEVLVPRPLAPPVVTAVRELIPEAPIPIKHVALPDQDTWFHSMVVLHYKQFPSIGPYTQSVTITLTEQQHSNLRRWTQRFAGVDEVEKSLCLSLCCYETSDLAQYTGVKIRQFGELKPGWPSDNALKFTCGEVVNLPLAPPVFKNENGFVDLSAFLVEGENKIEISQDRNLSQYAVAIFMHSPTRQQLESVIARRKKDQQWKTFLRDLGKPLVLEPTKCPWSATPA